MDWAKWNEFNRQLIEEFRVNGGKVGGQFAGAPVLLLTTIGRKSGQERTLPLVYGKDGDDLFIVASKAGEPKHPDWFLNLEANPSVTVEVGVERFSARARITSGEERARLFAQMAAAMPQFNEYQAKTDREIPVIVLSR